MRALVVSLLIMTSFAEGKYRLVIRKPSDRAVSARFGSTVDDYGSFVVVRIPADAVLHARAEGLDLEPMEENIGLGAYRFDPAGGPPALPARFRDDSSGSEPRYYLVQFRGPMRDEWVASLRGTGVQPIQYVPDNAVLVRATPSQIARASRAPEVRWSGLYHPAYKLGDDLGWLLGLSVQRVQGDRQRYRVAVFRAGDLDAVISAITALGGAVDQVEDVPGLYFRSLLVELDTGRIADLAALRDVARVETWYAPRPEDERANQIVAGNYSGTAVIATGYAAFLANRDVNGAGVTVGVVDDGVDATEQHLTGRVTDSAALRRGATAGADGHGHHDAGIVAGSCTHADPNGFFYASGMAPQAHVLNIPMLRNGYGGTEADAQSDVVTTAAGNGQPGTVSTNSWGGAVAPGYSSYEAMYDSLVHDASPGTPGLQPLAIVFSAGNNGPAAGSITSPHAAKNILVVGASENYRPTLAGGTGCGTVNADNIDQYACFSSRGPTSDGRIKPDISAPGTWIASALAGSSSLWGNIDASHRYSGGTSQACPSVAGGTALIQQWWKSGHSGQLPAPALSKALIINGAVDPAADPAGSVPNNTEGWGRMNLANVIATGVPAIYDNQEHILSNTGQTYSVGGTVGSASQPFRVTLVWSDAPGAAGANPALVNNLDLEVSVGGSLGASLYKGNVFSGGVSTTGGSADTRNNVEAVYFPAGAVAGPFTVTVRATSLGGDGAPGTGDATDQHFALVVFNAAGCSSPVPPSPSAAPNGSSRIDVSWAAVSGATSYKVFRSTTAGGPYTQVGSPAASPYADTSVTAYTAYYYVVRSVGACESADSIETSATALGSLGAPAGLAATLAGGPGVSLSWNAVNGAVSYRVYRSTNNVAWSLVGSPTGSAYQDNGVATGTAYLYKVRAVDPASHEYGDSNKALATLVFFTDPTLTGGATLIRAVHVSQLRAAVNAVRLLAGSPALSFTDPTLSTSIAAKRQHLQELRDGLDGSRATLGLPALSYTDSTITATVTPIKAQHIAELRDGAGAHFAPAPPTSQILLNPGFELGAVNWAATPGVIDNTGPLARSGSWKAWLDGYGSVHTDTCEQEVNIPSAATAATLSFWLNVATAETGGSPFDTLQVQIASASGAVLQTLATYSNLNATGGAYVQKSFNVLAYKGQTIKVRFVGTEDASTATSFLIDDAALDVTQ